jgi:hypothetical protein
LGIGAHTPTQFLYVHHLWPLALKFQQPWPLALKFGLLVAHSGRCTKLFTFWVRHAHALRTKQSVKPPSLRQSLSPPLRHTRDHNLARSCAISGGDRPREDHNLAYLARSPAFTSRAISDPHRPRGDLARSRALYLSQLSHKPHVRRGTPWAAVSARQRFSVETDWACIYGFRHTPNSNAL